MPVRVSPLHLTAFSRLFPVDAGNEPLVNPASSATPPDPSSHKSFLALRTSCLSCQTFATPPRPCCANLFLSVPIRPRSPSRRQHRCQPPSPLCLHGRTVTVRLYALWCCRCRSGGACEKNWWSKLRSASWNNDLPIRQRLMTILAWMRTGP